jgi:photosystem II stability/assembly factor-like uncharacterized protein
MKSIFGDVSLAVRCVVVVFFVTIILVFIPYQGLVQALQGEESLLYTQDFETDSLPDWEFEPGWDIIQSDGTQVLAGQGHVWTRLGAGSWSDYRLRFRVKLSTGAVLHANFRVSGPKRYFIGLGNQTSYLSKQTAGDVFQENLATSSGLGNGWQTVDVAGYGETITVSVNGQVIMSYTDPDPLTSGGIAFESITDTQVLIDDVEIWGEAAGMDVPTLPSEPGELTWIRTGGPLGGLGYDVRMRPDNNNIMYVTDAWAGVHKSTDGGQTWFPSNEGITTRKGDSLDSIPVFCLTIDPHNYDTIWIGTEHAARIFKSTDGGEHWVEMTNNIRDDFRDGLTFRGFTVHPQSSDIVYAAAEVHSWADGRPGRDGREFEMVGGVVYKTINGGQTWEQVWLGDSLARYIWINPQNPDVIYISTGIFDREAANSDPQSGTPGGEGILKSTNGGKTWEHANQGLKNLYIGSLFMHPENPDILLAGTGNNQYPHFGGVYLSTNGGQTWEQTLDDAVIEAVEFSETNAQIAYAGSANGVYQSDDGGHTWQKVTSEEWGPEGVRVGFPIDFQVDPHDPQRLFVNAYGGGNFISQDGGHSWAASSKGYTGAQVRALAVDPNQPGRVYAAARSGLFVSFNGGEDWTGISHVPAKVMEWNTVAVSPLDAATILSSNNWNSDLLFSSDSGWTWTLTNNNIEGMRAGWSVIAFAPSQPEIVYAGSAGYFSAGTFSPEMPGTGIYISQNGGRQWKSVNTPLTQDTHVRGLAVHPNEPMQVYAATFNKGLLHTTDGGQSWVQLSDGLPPQGAFSVAINPNESGLLLAGFFRAGIYASTDGGATWQPSSSGMPPEATITSLVFDPTNPAIVYAADIHSGVYRSQDGGQTWFVINNGLRTRAVNALVISGDGQHLYAATEGEGVYRLDLTGQPPESAFPPLPEATVQTEPDLSPSEPTMQTGQDNPPSNEPLPSLTTPFMFGSAVALLLVLMGLWFYRRRRNSQKR